MTRVADPDPDGPDPDHDGPDLDPSLEKIATPFPIFDGSQNIYDIFTY